MLEADPWTHCFWGNVTFPGQKPVRCLFPPLPPLTSWLLRSTLHSAWFWRLGNNNLATCYYKHEVLAGAAPCVAWKKQTGYSERKAPPPPYTLHGFEPGPSQLLYLPKGLDTVAQLAPLGPWHHPGYQPKQWHKKTTNKGQVSLLSVHVVTV